MLRLTPAGRRFRKWLLDYFEVRGCEPLAEELVREYDHLVTLRALAAQAREAGDHSLFLKTCAALSKSSASFVRLWKAAGLSTLELPAEIRNRR
jgi:hypothetical protein